jgi:hypothetical protein
VTGVGVSRERYSREVEPRPSRFADPAAYKAWCARADAWGAPKLAPIISPIDGVVIYPNAETGAYAHAHYFDTRANRALRGTVTGESMADWGPRYIREARAVLAMSTPAGQLWQRVAAS